MKIVIIGGVAAGAKVAAKSRRISPDAVIDIYTDDTHVSYSSCGLPYYIRGDFEDYRELLVRTPEEFEMQGIHVHLQCKAIKILPDENKIIIQDMRSNTAYFVDYDKLVIATGARPSVPVIQNSKLKNVYTVRRIEDGIAIKAKALTSKHVTIIGSGYIGIELLEAFVTLGLQVTMIEYLPNILPIFDDDMSKLIFEQLNTINHNRFEIITNEIVTEFSANHDGEAIGVRTGTGKYFKTDFVVIAAGVKANVDFAREAGIILGETGAIRVNKNMQTNIQNIYACGDCAEKTFMLNGSKMWVPLGSTANKEGRVVAMNLVGLGETFDGILCSAVVRCMSLTMSMTGLTVKKALSLGFNPIFVTVTKEDKVGYMPDVNNITLKLIADKTTGLLLGGQAIGAPGADKRINALTSALLGRLTIEEFNKNDFTYAPPYSTTIDPLLNAAQLLAKMYKENH